jgi:hypothetical protein
VSRSLPFRLVRPWCSFRSITVCHRSGTAPARVRGDHHGVWRLQGSHPIGHRGPLGNPPAANKDPGEPCRDAHRLFARTPARRVHVATLDHPVPTADTAPHERHRRGAHSGLLAHHVRAGEKSRAGVDGCGDSLSFGRGSGATQARTRDTATSWPDSGTFLWPSRPVHARLRHCPRRWIWPGASFAYAATSIWEWAQIPIYAYAACNSYAGRWVMQIPP